MPQKNQDSKPEIYNRDTVVRHTEQGTSIAQRHGGGSEKPPSKMPLLIGAVLVLVFIIVLAMPQIEERLHLSPTAPTAATQATAPSESVAQTQPPTETQPVVVGNDVLAAYDTDISGTQDRTNNLILACKAIDGTVLKAGQEFSFNRVVGERTEEKGYRPASIYADGDVVDEVGGGICQVASTLYLVALKADLTITERHCHQFPVSYLPLGVDASIYWGSQDLRFRNNTNAPLRIRASVEDDSVRIVMEGTKNFDGYIRMSYEVVETYEPDEILRVDASKEPGFREQTVSPVTGYLVKSFYNYYDDDDNLLRQEECDWSEYSKRDAIIVVGPEETEPEVTEPEETEEPPATEPPPETTEATLPPSEPAAPTEETEPEGQIA